MELNFHIIDFDIYSKKIGFFFNKKEKIGSILGFFLTVFYISVSLVLFIIEMIKIFQRKELKVYDTTVYSQEMPIIDANIEHLYFAFGLEYPNTATRYIDESIYTAKLTFFDKQKVNDEFVTVKQLNLEFDKCKLENFGKDYQDLFAKDELNNSYCLKDFDYNLTLAGSYKFNRITYLRIVIYPCVNNTKNNYTCKSQEEIDKHFNSGYFSIVIKDFGLNPSNYTSPRIPTLQDLYTTIDKRLNKNYIINFGLTEIHTDHGLFNENVEKKKYLQYRRVLENFSFREEKDYLKGKSLILVQLRLEDTIFVHKRTYTKISEVFSRIGGYMQLMNTIFLLLSSLINKIFCDIKIINSIFNFNFKENKMILKAQSFNDFNKVKNNNKNNIFISKRPSTNIKQIENDNKSKNNLILKENDYNNISYLNCDNKKSNENQKYTVTINKAKNIITFENSKNDSISSKKIQQLDNNKELYKQNQENNYFDVISQECYNYLNFNEHYKLNMLDFFCPKKTSQKYKRIKLYDKANSFYKKKMDIAHVFSLLSILENFIRK
jgi:hypothetical protein